MKFHHNINTVLLNKRSEISNNIWVIQVFKYHHLFWNFILVRFVIFMFFKLSRVHWAFIILNLLNFNFFNRILIWTFFCNIDLPKSTFSCNINNSIPIYNFLRFSLLRGHIFHFDKVLKHFSFLHIVNWLNFCKCLIIFVPIFLIISNIYERTKYFWRKH